MRASLAAEFQKRDWSDDRIYRRSGIGAKLLEANYPAAELEKRIYSDEAIGKILGRNLMPALKAVLPKN